MVAAQKRASTVYFTDTNCFRYPSASTTSSSSPEMVAIKKHKAITRKFWNAAIKGISLGKSDIMTCSEVEQELKVQSYGLKPKENREINNFLSFVEVDSTEIPVYLEYLLRDFSAYVRSKYRNLIVVKGESMEYLRVSDARIFVASYLNDAVLVTGNMKDFLLYPLFFEDGDDVLYDILNQNYFHIPLLARTIIQQDAFYQKVLKEMKALKY